MRYNTNTTLIMDEMLLLRNVYMQLNDALTVLDGAAERRATPVVSAPKSSEVSGPGPEVSGPSPELYGASPEQELQSHIHRAEQVIVYVHVHVLKMGEIDTVNEKFSAEVMLTSRWREPTLDDTMSKNHTAPFLDWNSSWNPCLSVQNVFSSLQEDTTYHLVHERGEAMVEEKRHIKGIFAESLELMDYPYDVQDLSVRITSHRDSTELCFVEDPRIKSSVNQNGFADRQQWDLKRKVKVWTTTTTDSFSHSKAMQPVLCTTCIVRRKYTFFWYNVVLVMIFIGGLNFTTFVIPRTVIQSRLVLSFFLLLSNITFKFTVSKTIPKVPYLTYMDKYILTSMIIMFLVCVWHAVVSHMPFDTQILNYTDKTALGLLLFSYIAFNIIFIALSQLTPDSKQRKKKKVPTATLR